MRTRRSSCPPPTLVRSIAAATTPANSGRLGSKADAARTRNARERRIDEDSWRAQPDRPSGMENRFQCFFLAIRRPTPLQASLRGGNQDVLPWKARTHSMQNRRLFRVRHWHSGNDVRCAPRFGPSTAHDGQQAFDQFSAPSCRLHSLLPPDSGLPPAQANLLLPRALDTREQSMRQQLSETILPPEPGSLPLSSLAAVSSTQDALSARSLESASSATPTSRKSCSRGDTVFVGPLPTNIPASSQNTKSLSAVASARAGASPHS